MSSLIRDPIRMTPGRIRELYVGCSCPPGETITNISNVTITPSLAGLTAVNTSLNAVTVEINGVQYVAGTAVNYDLDFAGTIVGGPIEAYVDFRWTGSLGTVQVERVNVEIAPALEGDYSDSPAIVMATPIETVLGISTGDSNMGAFTGSLFSDTASVKTLLQATETNLETLNTDVSQHQTLLGVVDGSTHLGTFTNRDASYPTIASNSTVKSAIQGSLTLLEQHGGFNVVRYGADPTGVADSSAAIKLAHDAAQNLSKVINPTAWYAPASITRGGTGNLTATLTVSSAAHLDYLDVGSMITVRNAVPATYNGKYKVETKGATTITYLLPSDPGANASSVGTFREESGTSIYRAVRPFVYFPPGEYQINQACIFKSGNGQQVKLVGNGATIFQGPTFPAGRALFEIGEPQTNVANWFPTLVEIQNLIFRDFDYAISLGFANANINLGRMVIRDCDFIGRIGGFSEAIRTFNRSASLTLDNVHFDNLRVGLEQQSLDDSYINQPRFQIGEWIDGASRKTLEGRFILRRGQMIVNNGIFNPLTVAPSDPITKPQSWFLVQEFPNWASSTTYRRGDMVFADATGSEMTNSSLTTYHAPSSMTASGTLVTLNGSVEGLRGINQGDSVVVAGATPSNYNGTWTVTSKLTATSIQFNTAIAPGGPASPVGTYRRSTTPQVTVLTSSAHNLRDGDWVVISGATHSDYNGTWQVEVDPTVSGYSTRFHFIPTNIPAANATVMGTTRRMKLWVCRTGYQSATTSGTHISAGSFATDQATHWIEVDHTREGNLSVWVDLRVRDSILGGEAGGINPCIWDMPPDGGWLTAGGFANYPRSVQFADCTTGNNTQAGFTTSNAMGGSTGTSPTVLMVQIPNRISVRNSKFSYTQQVAADYWSVGTQPTPWMPTRSKPLDLDVDGNYGAIQSNVYVVGGNYGVMSPNFVPRNIVSPSYIWPAQNGMYIPTGARLVRAEWGTAGNIHDVYAFYNVSEGQIFSVLCNQYTRIYYDVNNIITYDQQNYYPGSGVASEGIITFIVANNKAYEISRTDYNI